jgi:outer membrane protein assembly factor BamB
MKHVNPLVASLVFVAFASVELYAARPLAWPRFRGPNGSGVADGEQPPVEIGPNKNVKWKVAVPSGLSSPIIAGDKLIVTALDKDKLFTIAYSRVDGREIWRSEAPARQLEAYHKQEGSPAASTPATDGERIVSYFGSCGLFCYDLLGKELWRYELSPANPAGGFGSGVSPVLEDGLVILVRDTANDAKIMALDAATGSRKWQAPRTSPVSWSTPVVWDTPDGKQVVAAGHGRMIGYNLQTGDEAWSVAGMPSGCCASPVSADGTLFFAGWSPGGADDSEFQMPKFDDLLKTMDANKDGTLSREESAQTFEGFFEYQDTNKDGTITRDEYDVILRFMAEGKNRAFALQAGGSGDVTNSHLRWQQTKGLPYVASAILYRGQYVMVKDGGIVTAYDAHSGREIYMERVAASGSYYASPVAANGNIYFVALDSGSMTVLKSGQDKPVVVAENEQLGERVAATPAIADDTLYVRTENHLYAFANQP